MAILPQWFPGRGRDSEGRARATRRPRPPLVAPGERAAKPEDEWLITNQSGSFAMGTVDRIPRRKYHSLLTVREPGVGEPLNLIAELEDWFILGDETVALHNFDWGSSVEPDGASHLVQFDPQPRWTYRFAGLEVTRALTMEPDADAVWVRYAVRGVTEPIQLRLRPLLRSRPIHDLTVANPFLNGAVTIDDERPYLEARLRPYEGLPPIIMALHGAAGWFSADGHWYRGVHYAWERQRGYEDAEDLFTPGEVCIDIEGDTTFAMRLGTARSRRSTSGDVGGRGEARQSFTNELERAADAYLVKLRGGRTGVIAGYPWFGEWSRDALIALPGLCLARGKVEEAVDILESLSRRRENRLIPNIPQSGDVPANTNAIDASLLFVWATALTAKKTRSRRVSALEETSIELVEAVLDGADPRVRVDDEGFLFVEQGPWALTWMDAMTDGQPVTPRWGYAVDLNALWLSALQTTAGWAATLRPEIVPRLEETATKLADHFEERFWLQDQGFLTDTHDGIEPDGQLRPNQLWALVLPDIPVRDAYKRAALEAMREKLLTPVGLRTLSPDDPEYRGTYGGSQKERDLAYHQGTVWPWLLGLYAEAVRTIEGPDAAREELLPILTGLWVHFRSEGCIGQLSEVFDGDPPHKPGGAPAQAWSVAEALRIAMIAER
ncbi:MAG: amylo-alpha-1,6-glucosidase [Myxococcota bacterium]